MSLRLPKEIREFLKTEGKSLTLKLGGKHILVVDGDTLVATLGHSSHYKQRTQRCLKRMRTYLAGKPSA